MVMYITSDHVVQYEAMMYGNVYYIRSRGAIWGHDAVLIYITSDHVMQYEAMMLW